MRSIITIATIILTIPLANAKEFQNAYVSFQLPDTWKCTLEQTEWVCRSEMEKEAKEAIIILTAKEVGPTDSFASYTQHLGTPQPTTSRNGQKTLSKVAYAPKQSQINQHVWIDGLHMGSEIDNYYTRYLATIKERIAILVTLSAHKNYYARYSNDFFKAVQTLKVTATKNLLASPEMGPIRGQEGGIFSKSLPSILPDAISEEADEMEMGDQGNKTKTVFLAIAIVLASVAAYILLKMRKK